MAFYVFKCDTCSGLFEEEHPMSEAPSEAGCPSCSGVCPRYYGFAPGVIFKGGGWPSKNIKNGAPATSDNVFETENANRKKLGLPVPKEKPMSDEEFKKRKKANLAWIDSIKKN
jgi:putative FmdB family regulatory protein